MKKALAMALGAVLVAGSAAPASAASQIDFNGYYGAHYAVNGNLGYTSDDNLNESFFEDRLQVNVTFQATDEVSVHWRFRGPNGRRYGNGTAGDVSIFTNYIYGQVVQDWGTVRVGRIVGGLGDEFGLSSLGYAPNLGGDFTNIAPFEGSSHLDSIQYANSWDNGFGLVATYTKLSAWPDTDNITHYSTDHDSDRYQIQGTYQWDGGGAALNLIYSRDASDNGGGSATTGPIASVAAPGQADKTNIWFVNPAIMHSWGAFSFHAEGMFAFGKTEYYNPDNVAGVSDTDADGQGFYLDFDYNYGPGRVNLAGWWVSGNDVDDTDDNTQADIVAGNFYPLVVAYGPINSYYGSPSADGNRNNSNGAVNVANQGNTFLTNNTTLNVIGGTDNPGPIGTDVIGGMPAAITGRIKNRRDNGNTNHWAIMFSGQHAFTDEITFNYALAYLALNNPNYRAIESASVAAGGTTWSAKYGTQDKDLGFEIDLGVSIQLLDNLAFTSTFGYMFTGDAYKQLKGYRVSDIGTNNDGAYAVKAEWEDADNAYSWLNALTFSF